jgi:hypothetical protein
MKPKYRILLFSDGSPAWCYRVVNGEIDRWDCWYFEDYKWVKP